MTLAKEQSSNKTWFESETTENLIKIIRTAMEEGCIRPCHVYDAVDEALCRLKANDDAKKLGGKMWAIVSTAHELKSGEFTEDREYYCDKNTAQFEFDEAIKAWKESEFKTEWDRDRFVTHGVGWKYTYRLEEIAVHPARSEIRHDK